METNPQQKQIVLDLYRDFQKICADNNLTYFAVSGTGLGAVLWNGIIPWDDDMDIALPAEDYLKFCDICKKKLPKHLSFTEYIWFGGKLHDNRTMFTNVYYITDPDMYNGVFLDIVPLIGLPDDENERQAFIDKLWYFHNNSMLYEMYGRGLDAKTTLTSLKKERRNILTAYKYDKVEFVMDFSNAINVYRSEGFRNPIDFKFENSTIPVPSTYEENFAIQYGKWSKYPPKEQRQSVHDELGILDLNRSYREYQKDFKKLSPFAQKALRIKHANEYYVTKSNIIMSDQVKLLSKNWAEATTQAEYYKNRGAVRHAASKVKQNAKKLLSMRAKFTHKDK